jgi:hypothetical protein
MTAPGSTQALFTQAPPQLGNQFRDDPLLGSWLRRTMPPEAAREIAAEMDELGRIAGGELYALQLADRENEPVLRQWMRGTPAHVVDVSPLWRSRTAHGQAWTGSTAYRPAHGRHARVVQFLKVYLFHPSSDVYTCPLAMTDGAARCLIESGNQR